MAVGNIDTNSEPDVFFVWADDPSGANHIYYRVWYNMDGSGNEESTSNTIEIGGTGDIGDLSAGVGACMRNIDSDARPDMVVAWADDPSGDNTIRYRVAFNFDADGTADSWTATQTVGLGGIGSSTQGLGVACTNVDGTISPEGPDIVFAWIDDPTGGNRLHFRLGLNFTSSGTPASGWLNREAFDTNSIGNQNQGLGLAHGNFDNQIVGELVWLYVDNPSGQNTIDYRSEWNFRYDSHI